MAGWFVRSLAAAFVLTLALRSIAADVLNGPVQAALLRVIDGDTIEVRARIWLGLDLTTRVRLWGIDAPELDGRCHREREMARAARRLLAGSLSPSLVLTDIRNDRYGGRVVARVGTTAVEDVGGVLTAAGLAIPHGSTERWCG
ncbi:MAG: thermonuclease family protein [Rhodospirillales bacterium]|nr:thermonuclease family protein [Rhodospirillales bacterium]